MRGFLTRLISGIVLVFLALVFIISGGPVLAIASAVISLIGVYELMRVFEAEKRITGIIIYIFTLGYYTAIYTGLTQFLLPGFICMFILLLCVYVFSYPKYKVDDIAKAVFAFFYVSLLLSFIFLTRNLPKGEYMVWIIFLCSWGCDTCAYCVGMLFGKHKMSPVLSPKKSIEGAIGGIAGTVILVFIFCFIFKDGMALSDERIFILAPVCGIGAFISMIGDLAASAIKRNYEIKDYGKLIPGHGGILDRFDSVIITAPIVYYLILFT